MAETDVHNAPRPAAPRFELEQSADFSRYLLYSKSEILAVLRSLIHDGSMITVYFDQGQSFLLTSMIALTSGNRDFIVDFGGDEAMNARALRADKLIFTTLVDKVKVQFSLNRLSQTVFDGRAAFLGAVPDQLLRLQRREFFRLVTPVVNPLTLRTTVKRPDGNLASIEIPLLDISAGGVGLMATPDQSTLLNRGDTLADCAIELPDEGLLVATLAVRSLFDVTTRGGSHYAHVGCEYVGLHPTRVAMVQRYITRVERERKARLSGMA